MAVPAAAGISPQWWQLASPANSQRAASKSKWPSLGSHVCPPHSLLSPLLWGCSAWVKQGKRKMTPWLI